MLVLLETGLNSVGDALGTLQIQLHVHLASRAVAEVLKDLLLLGRSILLMSLLSAVSTVFEGLEKLRVLTFRLLTHLVSQVSFEAIKLVHESLLFTFVVLALRNLNLHLLARLADLKLLFSVLLVQVPQDRIDVLVVPLRLEAVRLIERLVEGDVKVVSIRCDVFDGIGLLHVASVLLEAILFILDRL